MAIGVQAGVEKMLSILEEELRSAMALLGARAVGDLDRYMVQLPNEQPPRRPFTLPAKL